MDATARTGNFLKPPAELDHALALVETFEVSREAAIRRYVALQGECLAAVFSRHDRVRYVEKSEDFPATTVWWGDLLTGMLLRRPLGSLTTLDETEAFRWLKRPDGVMLFAQTPYQGGGFAVTLLVAERDQTD